MTTDDFGRIITAMVTPFTPTRALDLDGVAKLATWLTRPGHNDGLVVNGTTGESGTTSDQEKSQIIAETVRAVPENVRVIAGVGTNDTEHSVQLAKQAEAAGAHGLLVVSPYYSKPSQDGLLYHFRAIASSTSLPVMIYDIPARTGVAITPETTIQLADHPRIVAVKDAKSDLVATTQVIRETDLDVYSGEDALNLPLFSIGAVGVVSVIAHFAADRIRAMLQAHETGDAAGAVQLHQGLLPITQAIFRAQGAVSVKAALTSAGQPAGPVRPPLTVLSAADQRTLTTDLELAGVFGDRIAS